MMSEDLDRRACVDAVAFVLAKCDGWAAPLPSHSEQASRVYAGVVGPLVRDIRLLRWLHAEAVWRLEMERLAHAVTIAQRDELLASSGRQFSRGWGDR